MDKNHLAAAGFYFTDGVMYFVAHSVEWRWDCGKKETMPLETINSVFHLVISSRVCFSETFQLLLMAKLNHHHLTKLVLAMMCVGHIRSYDQIPVLSEVSIITFTLLVLYVCVYSGT
jgi:hypothetical protein